MNTQNGYIWPNLAGGPVITSHQGIDYIIVLPSQSEIEVHFFESVTAALENKDIYHIKGGERILDIKIDDAVQINFRTILLSLDQYGDWAPYRLSISESVWETTNLDAIFSRIDFSFKINCPNDIDCKAHLPGFEKFPRLHDHDFMAKDYESIKQAMLDRLPSTIFQWWDRAEADFGLAIVDLLAYVGDRLSYYQDRVATESQLSTARSRESVNGHLKLLDYALDPGETAEVFLHLEVKKDMIVAAGTQVQTPAKSYETPVVFTLPESFAACLDLNRLTPYDFDHPTLFIPKGARSMTIQGHPEGLQTGSRLVISKGDDSSGWERHTVIVIADPIFKKALDGSDITLLIWDKQEALPWDAQVLKTRLLGNNARFIHGQKYTKSLYAKEPVELHDLSEGPLGYQNHQPLMQIKIDGEVWQRVISLKESQPYDMHYQVVDRDNGKNRILFGDNINGYRPPKYAHLEIEYFTGIGRTGNVASKTLTRLPVEVSGIVDIFNPFPGKNGLDPETKDHGKLWGPKRIREQKRAVTPDDYVREAMLIPGISRVKARFVWTGSWVTVRITLDPEETSTISPELRRKVFDHLMSVKMAGYDLQIFPAYYVPLEIDIRFCLQDMSFRDQVFRDLNSALGDDLGADDSKGFFHPDNWSFGQSVTLSGLYAAIARVQGIDCAEVMTFKRLLKPQNDELTAGIIPMQWDEIPRLENDRNFPEHGKMNFELVGGR